MNISLQAPFTLPAGARSVVLVRHGSARHSPNGKRYGPGEWADPDLSELGTWQAARLADRLQMSRLDQRDLVVFASPLRRATQTADLCRSPLGGPAQLLPDLREVHLGAYEGAAFATAWAGHDQLLQDALRQERWDLLTDAEPQDHFEQRIRRVLTEVAAKTPPGTSAFVFTHGGVIAEACHLVTSSRTFAFNQVENTSLTELICDDRAQWTLRSYNDTAHLTLSESRSAMRVNPTSLHRLVALSDAPLHQC